jgi:hypothetical protein
MTNKTVTMPLELAENIFVWLSRANERNEAEDITEWVELRSLLAAPAVERQEPVKLPERSFVGDIRNPYRHTVLHDGYISGWNAYQDAMVKIGPLYTSPPAPVAIPEECPHLIVFDDAERENLMFTGAGARSAALKTWEQISISWNAHLFVRIERNSRDDRYPSATATPVAVVLPTHDAVCDLIAETIGGDTYDCTRVWSAWGVGTMSEDDFVPVSQERIEEMADVYLNMMKALNQ